MAKFSHVIVRRPGKSLCDGITSAPELGKPIYEKAIKQHDAYIEALKQCGVDVTVLPAMEEYPDSCFVEDTAVITRCGAIIDNPGAGTRNGEAKEMEPTIRQFFDDDHIAHITAPGTLEGGDVMMVGDHFYVGRSARTNEEGIRQFIEILESWGLSGSEVPLEYVLHLKTGVNYLEDNNMLVSGEFKTKPDFEKYNKVEIPEDEAYAANCIWVNGTVIVPEGSDIASVDDLAGKKIGTQRGTTGYLYCSDDFGEDAVVAYDNGLTAVQALNNGQVDAVVIDNEPAKAYVESNPGLKILDTSYAEEDYAIGMNKSNTALLEAVNAALEELKADGTLQAIVDKYIKAE